MVGLIVLDANVIIAFLDEKNVHHSRSIDLLSEYEFAPWVMHEVTLAEVLAGPAKAGTVAAEKVWAAIQELGVISAESEVSPLGVATLRAETGLPIPDCLVILTADGPDSENQIMTFDEPLAAKASELGYSVLC